MTRIQNERTVTRIAGPLGALVEGIRLGSINDDEFAFVQAALLEHHVLFFRDQHLTEDEHLALVGRWGEPIVFPVAALTGGRNPMGVITDTADSPPDADGWHTDVTWWHLPPSVAVLCALSTPPAGGDTMWINLHRVYDNLSEPLRRICDTLTVLHTPGERFIAANARIQGEEIGRLIAERLTGSHHPLVRSHPVTGRPALFVSESFMRHIDGMTSEESALWLGMLARRLDDPNVQVRWRWRDGDVAIWDEACTNHRALSDHYPQFRQMRRCTASGDRPWFSPDGTREHASFVSTAVAETTTGAAPASHL